jgi:hypothetical protein
MFLIATCLVLFVWEMDSDSISKAWRAVQVFVINQPCFLRAAGVTTNVAITNIYAHSGETNEQAMGTNQSEIDAIRSYVK